MRNLAILMYLAVVASGALTSSLQSAEAKTSQNASGKAKNILVPPPPPYTPTIGSSGLSTINSPMLTAGADDVYVEKSGNFYIKHLPSHVQGDTSEFVHTNSGVRFNPAVEIKIQKHIDDFDSEISNSQKEIGKLLHL